jgi:hypothetical protein
MSEALQTVARGGQLTRPSREPPVYSEAPTLARGAPPHHPSAPPPPGYGSSPDAPLRPMDAVTRKLGPFGSAATAISAGAPTAGRDTTPNVPVVAVERPPIKLPLALALALAAGALMFGFTLGFLAGRM